MSFELQQIAIHEIIKSADDAEAKLFLTDQLLPANEQSELLAEKLHQIYNRKNEVLTAQMASSEDELFAGYFQEAQDENFSEASFLKFSQQSTQSLQLNIQGIVGAKGGFLCYIRYRVFEQSFLAIYILRNAEGLLFKQTQEQSFEINPSVYLELDKMAMACRISLNTAQNGQMELIKHSKSQKEVSDYFLHWLGVQRSTSNRELTTTFLDAVSNLPLPVDEESGEPIRQGVFREQIAKFAAKSPSKTINIESFDENFFGEEKPLQNYLDNQGISLENEFAYNRETMRNFHFHKFKSKGLYFGCRHDFILSGKVSLENGKIVIDDEDIFQEIYNLVTEGK